VPTDKRQRQKAGRQERLAAEEKIRKRRLAIRRAVLAAVIIVAVVGISYALFSNNKKSNTSSTASTTTSTTSHSSTTTSTQPVPTGGSGDKSPSAITTSADCPSSFSATLNKPSYSSVPATTIDPSKTYTATVTTDVGAFTIKLDPTTAPVATNSFVFLAEHHFYDCIIFHRVIPGFVDQTGDPTGTGTGGPGYQYAAPGPAKANPQYPLGSVAMANSNQPSTTDPNTNGSQFFIVTGSSGESLPPDYTLFGQVTSGMSVVQKINADGTSAGTPKVVHRMISVTVTSS
jgi:cyclophilin family peptidyl-prolyl cis-trans isomerase